MLRKLHINNDFTVGKNVDIYKFGFLENSELFLVRHENIFLAFLNDFHDHLNT